MKFKRPFAALASHRYSVALGLSLLCIGQAEGAIRFWNGGGGANANWSNSGNWSTGVLPLNGDDLVFNAGALNLVNTNNLLYNVTNATTGTSGFYRLHKPDFITFDKLPQPSIGSDEPHANTKSNQNSQKSQSLSADPLKPRSMPIRRCLLLSIALMLWLSPNGPLHCAAPLMSNI